MNNINIKNIFINNDNPFKGKNDKNDKNDNFLFLNEINTYNLASKNKLIYVVDDNFIINKIKHVQKYENDLVIEVYQEKFKECLLKINDAIDINIKDIFFTVSTGYFGCKKYDSHECLKYIEDKLRKKKFETLITSKIEIFISWRKI
jgi:hypothetical protein